MLLAEAAHGIGGLGGAPAVVKDGLRTFQGGFLSAEALDEVEGEVDIGIAGPRSEQATIVGTLKPETSGHTCNFL